MNSKNRFVVISLVLVEFILLNLVLLILFIPKIEFFNFEENTFLNSLTTLILIYNFSWLLIILYIRDKDFYFDPDYRQIKNFILNVFFFIGFASTLVVIFKVNYFARSTFLLPIFIYSYLNFIIQKSLVKFLRDKGNTHFISNILLITSGKEYSNLLDFTKNVSRHGYNILGYLDDIESKTTTNGLGLKIVGNVQDLPNVLDNNSIDEIFITISSLKEEKIKEAIKIADNFGVRVKLVPENPVFIAKKCTANILGDIAVFQLRQSPLDNMSNMILKRLFDFWFALLVIILLSPLYLIIGIIIYLDKKGPIFYAPIRKGESGGIFKCYKFRTMSESDDPLNGTKSTAVNDARITRVGKILRKTDLDELPQFFNVLKGEMSVIGPRPHRTNLQNDFRKKVNDYMVRSYVKPGITGWAQVNGWRGPTVTDDQKKQRVSHDLWYIENWSFWLDIKIIFLTLFGRHRKNAF